MKQAFTVAFIIGLTPPEVEVELTASGWQKIRGWLTICFSADDEIPEMGDEYEVSVKRVKTNG